MGKSSASLKRKRSKNSAKARAKSKSKSRKYKSKKSRHHEVSLSSSDYDDSTSLNTSLSSSSEDSHRHRRERSHTRKDVKGRKKRARRRSYSPDSSEDSLHVRRRKREKRKREYEAREKPYQKKMRRKDASVSSVSSGSRSCSTCQGGSASSDDSEVERRRGRLIRKEKDKRRSERGRSGSERGSRYRARSCSSCSHRSKSCDTCTEERYTCENSSRRLRSVITVTKNEEGSRELCRNETKEEIVDDHDYPCRSNDSNDGACKRELDQHSHPSSEGKVRVEDEKGEENADFNLTQPEIRDRSYNSGSQYDTSNLKVYGAGTSESIEKETIETSGGSLNDEHLELTLKLKALENLRKFQHEVLRAAKASDQKNKIDSVVKQPLIENHEVVQGKSIVNNMGAKFDKKALVKETGFPGKRDLIASLRNNERNLNEDKVISGSVKHQTTNASEKVIDAANPCDMMIATESRHHSLRSHPSLIQTLATRPLQEKLLATESTIDKLSIDTGHFVSQSSKDNVKNVGGLCSAAPKPSCPVPNFRRNDLNKGQGEVKEHSQFDLKQTSASNELPLRKSLVTGGNVDKNAATTAQAESQSVNNSGRDVGKLSNSATPKPYSESSSVENSSNKLQDEANQGSQFEQKTMNVMRGGEMVQVSYKVYIPKKSPALARRQLKR